MSEDNPKPAAAEAVDVGPLFRPEVLEAQARQAYGPIGLAQPIATWLVVVVSLLLGGCLVALILFGKVTRKATVIGMTVPKDGTLSVTAPTAGILLRSLVSEGQPVAKGEPMFEVSTEHRSDNGEISALIFSQLSVRQATLERERRTRLTQEQEHLAASSAQLENLGKELVQLEREIALTGLRQDLARQSVAKYDQLLKSGFVSAAQQQQKQEELIDISLRLGALERSKVQLTATRLAVQAERAAFAGKLTTDIGQIDRALASVNQEVVENQGRKTALVVAPQAGIVSAVTYQKGQTVNAGQMLAALVPSKGNDLLIHLYAPSRAIGFVAEGQQVLVRYHAYPYQKFGLYSGTVLEVSRTPFAPNELPPNLAGTVLSGAQQNGASPNEALYRIKVNIDRPYVNAFGSAKALKPGMTLEADIVQERRAIWEWILEPLLAVVPR